MRDVGARADQAAGVRPRKGEAWVSEKGLPRICRDPLIDHPGRRMLLATDLSNASDAVDVRAIEFAEGAGASLLILTIIRPEASGDRSFQKRLGAPDPSCTPAGDRRGEQDRGRRSSRLPSCAPPLQPAQTRSDQPIETVQINCGRSACG